jgi:hypothetical protein
MRTQITAFIIALGLIATALIIGQAYKYRFRSAEGIQVVGLAEVDFTSDLIVWEGTFQRKSMNLREAYAALKTDETAIRDYLKRKGIADSSVIVTAVNLQKEYDQVYDNRGTMSQVFSGYKLSQSVKIESRDIPKIESLSREVTELIEKGIEFNSADPRYFYTKLSSLKMDLLSKASADARQRAEAIAESVQGSLGKLKKANMGVFQITGKNSDEDFSYGGSFNTKDKFKTASITIRMEYGLK